MSPTMSGPLVSPGAEPISKYGLGQSRPHGDMPTSNVSVVQPVVVPQPTRPHATDHQAGSPETCPERDAAAARLEAVHLSARSATASSAAAQLFTDGIRQGSHLAPRRTPVESNHQRRDKHTVSLLSCRRLVQAPAYIACRHVLERQSP